MQRKAAEEINISLIKHTYQLVEGAKVVDKRSFEVIIKIVVPESVSCPVGLQDGSDSVVGMYVDAYSPKGLRQHKVSVRDCFLELRGRDSDHSVDNSFSLLFGYVTLNQLSHHCCFLFLTLVQDVVCQAAQVLAEFCFNIVDILKVYFSAFNSSSLLRVWECNLLVTSYSQIVFYLRVW
jgi:hypothetical protein